MAQTTMTRRNVSERIYEGMMPGKPKRIREDHTMQIKQKWIRILRTMLTTGLAFVVNYGITLILTPYITETIGTDAYGFVSLAKQFANYAIIFTMALNTYAARYIGIAWHNGEEKEASKYFSSVFFGDLILVSVILLIMIPVIAFLEHIISIPAPLVRDVKLLFLLVFLNFWSSTVASVFGCAAYIGNCVDLTGIFKTVSCVTNALVIVICFVVFSAHIWYVGIGMLAATFVIGGSDLFITRRTMPAMKIRVGAFSGSAVKRLVLDGCWASFNSIGETLNSGLDLIVANQMLSSLAMGQLAIAKTMHQIMQSLYAIVDQAFIPLFLKNYAEEKKDKLLEDLKMSMKVSGCLANLLFAGFAALGTVYYRLWIPNQDIDLIYRLTMITILTCVPSGAVHPLYYIYTLTVKKKIPCFATVIGGVFNVIGMYVLIRYFGMGIEAVAWTTAAVMFAINFGSNPLYMAHCLKLPLWTFYPGIIRNVISCGTLVLIFKGLTKVYLPGSWLTFAACIPVYLIIGAPVHFAIVLNRDERRRVFGFLAGRLKR